MCSPIFIFEKMKVESRIMQKETKKKKKKKKKKTLTKKKKKKKKSIYVRVTFNLICIQLYLVYVCFG